LQPFFVICHRFYKEEVVEKIARERAARLYASNQDASRALGIAAGTFGRLCRQYGIETPHARRRRPPRRIGLDADELIELN
jgi:hypothetical protein